MYAQPEQRRVKIGINWLVLPSCSCRNFRRPSDSLHILKPVFSIRGCQKPVVVSHMSDLRWYDMNWEISNAGRYSKNWILPEETIANRFFRDSHWLEIRKNY
jgi:hypothetical protein